MESCYRRIAHSGTRGTRLNAISITKRQLLSQIRKIFDPLGLLGPIVLKAKLYMREVWLDGCGWDEPLPVELTSRWKAFERQFEDLRALKIVRWTGATMGEVYLHGVLTWCTLFEAIDE